MMKGWNLKGKKNEHNDGLGICQNMAIHSALPSGHEAVMYCMFHQNICMLSKKRIK